MWPLATASSLASRRQKHTIKELILTFFKKGYLFECVIYTFTNRTLKQTSEEHPLTFYSVPCILSLIKTLSNHRAMKIFCTFPAIYHWVLLSQSVGESVPIILLYLLRSPFESRFFQFDLYSGWMFGSQKLVCFEVFTFYLRICKQNHGKGVDF